MPKVQKIDISSSTIFRTILILVAVWFLFLIRDILVILIAAIVIASAIEPLAKRLRKYKVPRALSVVIVYVVFLGLIGGAIALIVPALGQQSSQLSQSVRDVLVGLEDRFALSGTFSTDAAITRIQDNISQITQNVSNVSLNIFQQTRNFFSGLISILFVLIIALYLVIEENALAKFFRLVVPKEHMPYVNSLINRIQNKIGRWVLAQMTLGVIIGLAVGIGLWLIGVPHALALGVMAGVLELIPVIGPIIAGFLAVIVALSQSLILGIVTLVFFIIVQQLENHLLIPNIMKRATGLNPLVTLIAVLLGARLLGVVGVILAVPTATIISIFMSDFFTNQPVDDELAG